MIGRPSGTVTFLFTDIEGSTRLWDRQPDAMRSALAHHDEILREAIDAHDGVVFATGGDGVAAAFHRAADAVSAAVAAQRNLRIASWPEGVEMRVRMGLHTGEADERDGDYFGTPVNRAARLMGSAGGGQIVISDVTAGLLQPAADLGLVDLGAHRLKGLQAPVRVFGVTADDLPWLDRPLVTDQHVPGNLPRPMTEFVGRLDLLLTRTANLSGRSLLTLTGPGGVGKTRTAVEIGWMSLDSFTGGVWFVELAGVIDPAVVVAAVAAELSVPRQPGVSMLSSLVDWLQGRELMLILDNCEHVLAPVVELVDAIAQGCPSVTVLATSREPLGIAGEHVATIAALGGVDAVELFCERAVATDDSLVLAADDRELIEQICTRLDRIPLAIELAAARMRALTLNDLMSRLDDRFQLLRGSGRGGLDHHHALRATVSWSYDLLTEEEQIVFDRVSAFSGGFDLPAAEHVCASPPVSGDDIFDLLSSLVDKSMIVAERGAQAVRYRLLETLRQYGEECLIQRGEAVEVRNRHLAHVASLTCAAKLLRLSPRQAEGEALFDREWDNVRCAVDWAIASGSFAELDLLMFDTLSYAWHRMRVEYDDWARRILADDRCRDLPMSGTVSGAAALTFMAGNWTRTRELGLEGLQRGADGWDVARMWLNTAWADIAEGRAAEASMAVDRARSVVPGSDDVEAGWILRYARAGVALYADPASMPAAVEDLRQFAIRVGAPWMLAEAHEMQAHLAFFHGDYAGALVHYRDAHARAVSHGSVSDEAINARGIVASLLALPGARLTPECHGLIARLYDTRVMTSLWPTIDEVAGYLARRGSLEEAGTAVGYLDAHVPPLFGSDLVRSASTASSSCSTRSPWIAWRAGRRWTATSSSGFCSRRSRTLTTSSRRALDEM